MPTLTINSAEPYGKPEGNTGSTPFSFTVTRSGDLTLTSSVSWAITGSGLSPANGLDFTGNQLPSGIADFAPGVGSRTVVVNVLADTLAESNEGFLVTLSNPSGARISPTGGSAESLILDDDTPSYSFSLSPSPVYEGGSLTVSVSSTNASEGSMLYWQAGGVGITPSDFGDGATGGSIAIGRDGRASFSKTIAADAIVDPDENLELRFFSDAARTRQVGSTLSVTIKEPSVGVATDRNDTIIGTDAGEIITGVPTGSLSRGSGSVDRLTGEGGADLFKLGDSSGSYYIGQSINDLAVITDFTAVDKIQLSGNPSRYRLVSSRYYGINGVRIDTVNGAFGMQPDVVAFVNNATLPSLNLNNPNQFVYV